MSPEEIAVFLKNLTTDEFDVFKNIYKKENQRRNQIKASKKYYDRNREFVQIKSMIKYHEDKLDNDLCRIFNISA